MKKGSRKKTKKNKGLFIALAAVLVVGIGFAALQKYLTINGTATINSNFDVRFFWINTKEISGGAYNRTEPSFTDTTATFDAMFLAPGDAITYNLGISNLGTMNAKLDNIDVNIEDNENISYEIVGIQTGDVLESRPNSGSDELGLGMGDGPGGATERVFTLKLSYTGSASERVSSNVRVTMKFVQAGETETQTNAISLIENEKPTLERYIINSISNSKEEIPNTPVIARKVELLFNTNSEHIEQLDSYFVGTEVSQIYYGGNLKVVKRVTDDAFVTGLNYGNNIKIRNVYSINGKIYFTKYSDEIYLNIQSQEGFIYDANHNDNIIGTDDTYFTNGIMTLPVGRKFNKMTSNNITKVIIPENYNLSDLGEFSLPFPSVYGTSLNTIVNKTGESINWAPILGYYSYGLNGAETCEFVTGTCAGVNIVAE